MNVALAMALVTMTDVMAVVLEDVEVIVVRVVQFWPNTIAVVVMVVVVVVVSIFA